VSEIHSKTFQVEEHKECATVQTPLIKYILYQFKEDEMGRASGAHEKSVHNIGWQEWMKDQYKDPGTDKRLVVYLTTLFQ
jgi:hypothetical protein